MFKPFLVPAVLAVTASLSIPESAHAATTCTPISTSLEFGTPPSDTTAVVTVDCSTFGVTLLSLIRVRMCLHIGPGGAGGGQMLPRRMTNSFDDPLDFQIYQNAARNIVWGSSGTSSPIPLTVDFEYPVLLLGGSNESRHTMYGRIGPGDGRAAGEYSTSFAGDARLDYRYAEPVLLVTPWPSSCTSGGSGGGSVTFSFTASASVPDSCEIDLASDLDFGSVPGLINEAVDQQSAVTLTCTRRTAWDMSLEDGQHATGGTRRMVRSDGGGHLVYELYRDPSRTLRWGTIEDGDVESGVGTGSQQSVTVYGRVPAGQAIPAGGYRDTVTLTISY
ncbi:spore coat U domain-containing protein [Luteimonas sp. MJ293]|uniref:Csu type fimbrial protein n=1 Tax=Luteimonas sp. MJ146 TaxID=3129240 RepID=UPI0031B9EBCF